MIERLLVGLDGSKLAEAVLPLAERFARASGGQLLLVRATTGATLEVVGRDGAPFLRYSPSIPAAPSDPTAKWVGVQEAGAYLDELATDLRSRDIAVETIVSAGEPADVLVEQARLRHADLILLTTHGRSGLDRLVSGSVAEAVLARSDVPVLLARAETSDLGARASSGIWLLVPLDGSRISERALTSVCTLAYALAAQIILTRIVATPAGAFAGELADFAPPAPGNPPDEDERSAWWYLEEVAEQLRAAGYRVSTTVRTDDPAKGILAVARDYRVTCVVMGSHGRTGLTRALLGSVALDVLRQGVVPVLLVGPEVPTHRSRLLEVAWT